MLLKYFPNTHQTIRLHKRRMHQMRPYSCSIWRPPRHSLHSSGTFELNSESWSLQPPNSFGSIRIASFPILTVIITSWNCLLLFLSSRIEMDISEPQKLETKINHLCADMTEIWKLISKLNFFISWIWIIYCFFRFEAERQIIFDFRPIFDSKESIWIMKFGSKRSSVELAINTEHMNIFTWNFSEWTNERVNK